MGSNLRNIWSISCGTILAIWLTAQAALGQVPASPSDTEPADASVQPSPAKPRDVGGGFGGAGFGGGMGGPGMGSPGYKATWYPSQPVSPGAGELGFVRQNLSGAAPIWRDSNDTLILMGGIRNTLFSTDVILPDTQRPFPSQLWNISTGLMYIHKFDNGWTSGLSTTFGSASDKPFHSLAEMNVGFFGFLQTPARNDRDAWIFSLMYSPVGNVNFPLPGIAYLWKPSDDLHMNIGIPFTVRWNPFENLSLTFSYIPVTNINARASYKVQEGLEIYGGFEWLNEAYFLADRLVRQDRFLAFEKRLISGIRRGIGKHATLDINAGYSFDRYYGEGQNQFSNLQDQVNVSPGAFLGASFLVRW